MLFPQLNSFLQGSNKVPRGQQQADPYNYQNMPNRDNYAGMPGQDKQAAFNEAQKQQNRGMIGGKHNRRKF